MSNVIRWDKNVNTETGEQFMSQNKDIKFVGGIKIGELLSMNPWTSFLSLEMIFEYQAKTKSYNLTIYFCLIYYLSYFRSIQNHPWVGQVTKLGYFPNSQNKDMTLFV